MAAAQLGYEAFALTDHNALSGSMEFAQAAKAVGVKAIHGAEIDVVDEPPADPEAPRRHLTLLVRDARGLAQPLPPAHAAHAHTRAPDGRPSPTRRASTLADVEEHAEGLVCLSGCAAHGVRDEPTMRRLLAAFGRDSLRVELQRPFLRHDRALNRGLAALAAPPRRRHRGDGQRPRAHARARAAAGRVRRDPRAHDARRLRAAAPRQPRHVLATPAAMAARFADHPEAVAETARARRRR